MIEIISVLIILLLFCLFTILYKFILKKQLNYRKIIMAGLSAGVLTTILLLFLFDVVLNPKNPDLINLYTKTLPLLISMVLFEMFISVIIFVSLYYLGIGVYKKID